MTKRIGDLRAEIDKTNLELLNILNRRTKLVKEISELKDQQGMEYFDPEREHEMMEQIINNNPGPLYNELVKEFFATVFKIALEYMGKNHEKKLLISSYQDNGFLDIQNIFGLQQNEPMIIAGPCAIESYDYLDHIGRLLKNNGVRFLRGGAYKPRTSPYEFQGLKKDGLKILHEIGQKYGLFTITEVVDTRDVGMIAEYADVLQVGARNMHNFELLKEVGASGKPVILKRGISATIQELMYAAEYIGLQGNRKLILCERGIRTYETKTRNTLDIASIPIVKKETNLPIIVDLSHSLGRKDIVKSIAKAALAAGADGVMVEVHPIPELALSDSKQQLNPEEFIALLQAVNSGATAASKVLR